MFKIFYNNDGWVCERFPYDLPIEDETKFMEVSQEEYEQTMGTQDYHAWRVVDGKLREELFEEIPAEVILENLRGLRDELCFPIINRGGLWHDLLNEKQKNELKEWYTCWLNVTNTKEIPKKPHWLEVGGKDE